MGNGNPCGARRAPPGNASRVCPGILRRVGESTRLSSDREQDQPQRSADQPREFHIAVNAVSVFFRYPTTYFRGIAVRKVASFVSTWPWPMPMSEAFW